MNAIRITPDAIYGAANPVDVPIPDTGGIGHYERHKAQSVHYVVKGQFDLYIINID
jgi:hypothetical protein